MKALFIIDKYSTNAGASRALKSYMENNPELEEPVAFCTTCMKADSDPFAIQTGNGPDVLNYYLEHGYQCIHFYRSDGWELFDQLVREAQRRNIRVPIVTTVCQKPSYRSLMLRPYEIKHSDVLAFIDKAAYNDSAYSFIPPGKKVLNYCGRSRQGKQAIIDQADQFRRQNPVPVIGRASTINKCPDDMFEVFDRLDNPKKILIIGGKGDEHHKRIIEQCNERKNLYEAEITGHLSYQDYMKRMTEIDIFLYHLRQDAHSSLDGTLGTAMLMGKPCVYMGPPAPEERFEQGVNGFVAKSKDELVRYTNMLIHDPELRKRIGENARTSTLRDYSMERTLAIYNEIYPRIVSGATAAKVHIPLTFYLRYYCLCRIPQAYIPRKWYYDSRYQIRRFAGKVKGKLLSMIHK